MDPLAILHRHTARARADELLRLGVRVHPESRLLTWRAAELTTPRNRKRLAHALDHLIDEVADEPSWVPVTPVNRQGLRPHLALVASLAMRLARLERPVSARGILLVNDLLTDVFASPLFGRKRERQVREALESSLAALDGA